MTGNTPGSITVLTVLGDEELSSLRRILTYSSCRIEAAGRFEEAVAMIRGRMIGVGVVGYRLADSHSWRDLLHEGQEQIPSPRLIVTDRLADEAMWAEVLNLEGYDVLAQPFDAREAIHTIECAWQSWQRESEQALDNKSFRYGSGYGGQFSHIAAPLETSLMRMTQVTR